jgi:hypothetical protein
MDSIKNNSIVLILSFLYVTVVCSLLKGGSAKIIVCEHAL